MSLTEFVPSSGVNDIDGILAGTRWGIANISYSFPAWDGTVTTPLNAAEKTVVQQVFAMVSSFTNLTFTKVDGDAGEMRFGMQAQDPGVWAYAYFPGYGVGGDSFYSNDGSLEAPRYGTDEFVVFMHEMGHALGLKHPFDGDPLLSAAHNNTFYTVMAYDRTSSPTTYMQCDIAALQYMYGANFSTNASNTTYRWDPATGRMTVNGIAGDKPFFNEVCMTVWDGGGTDTYDLSKYTTSVHIDLRPGEWSLTSTDQMRNGVGPGNIANPFLYNGDVRSLIENAIGGSGNDTLIGNQAANLLNGGAGTDSMSGGAGNDTYQVDSAGDTVAENANGGTDTVRSQVSFVLSNNVENLVLVGSAANGTGNGLANALTGNAGNNSLNGDAGDDVLIGGDGADTLNGGAGLDIASYQGASAAVVVDVRKTTAQATGGGGNDTLTGIEGVIGTSFADTLTGSDSANVLNGGAGADTMNGGGGNDSYYVDTVGDAISDSGGVDRVFSSMTFTLASTLENLTLTGSAALSGTGNNLANALLGNSGANNLVGLGGNDQIDGGAGADKMTGGAGNDSYFVDNSGDQLVESAGEGTDSVASSVNFALGANLENLSLIGTRSINGTGNGANNMITGNSADNILDGGAGADSLSGGGGNDRYYVDNAADTVSELAGEGIDRVLSSIAYTLGWGLEDLTLTGSAAINGTGNALDNALTGNAAANVLRGLAGADRLNGSGGGDTMYGGAGNDSYVVDSAGDHVIEASATDGIDTVTSSVAFALGNYLENLTLAGSSAISGTGNALDNVLIGNGAANALDGGAGADRMEGGGGGDSYVVDSDGDVIVDDGVTGTDKISSSISYTLGSTIEQLVLTGTAAINGSGNDLDNRLTGNGGNNRLNGQIGADTMIGGAGNDVYVVDNAGDIVAETSNHGTDLVQSAISYTLGANVENLQLTADYTSGTGNAVANRIDGSAGTNYLTGGLGADRILGHGGDDYLYILTGADVVAGEYLSGGDGIDQLYVQTSDAVDLSVATVVDDIEQLIAYGTVRLSATQLDAFTYASASDIQIDTAGSLSFTGVTLYVSMFDLLVAGISLSFSGLTTSTTVHGSDGSDVVIAGDAGSNLTGGAGGDSLTGGAGMDYLTGGLGQDKVRGADGDDYLIVTSADEIANGEIYSGGAGTDQLQAQFYDLADFTGVSLSGIEQLYGYGTLRVTAAQASAVSSVSASVLEIATAGSVDFTGASLSLGSLTLVVGGITLNLAATANYLTVNGSDGADVIKAGSAGGNYYGNGGADTLTGGAGSDYLFGGLGADKMSGGGGDDYFVINSAGEVVNGETYGGGLGTDQITVQTYDEVNLAIASISASTESLYAYGAVKLKAAQLGAFASVQASQVTITSAGTADLTGAAVGVGTFNLAVGGITLKLTGTASYATINGSSEADVVYGGDGGATMNGADGGDRLTGGAGGDSLIGEDGADTISGGAGADTLTGGLGLDHLAGGTGADYLVIATAADVTAGETYAGGADFDTIQVQTSDLVDLTGVTIGADVEGLQAYGAVKLTAAQLDAFSSFSLSQVQLSGTGTVNLAGATGYLSAVTLLNGGITLKMSGFATYLSVTGSNGGDVIVGSDSGGTIDGGGGNDRITGGMATDSLTGGAGADQFIFATALGGAVDYINDFSVTDDTITLDRSFYSEIAATGTLNAAAFYAGSAAHDADDRIIYDPSSGYFYYDADGTGATAQAMVGYMGYGLAVTNADFLIVT